MGYDIIGDIHGQADKLEALLTRMGYRNSSGHWQHAGRQAIFVGDFIDRGPDQLRTMNIARRMVEHGAALAIMGNHEFNAIAWQTPNVRRPGEYLRPHQSPKDKNRKQHAAFLAEVEQDAERHQTTIDWFLTLPLWLDLPELRVVHACWHAPFMDFLAPRLVDGRYLSGDLMIEATDEPEDEAEKDNAQASVFKAVEALTKGIEAALPEGHSFLDKDGNRRKHVRVRWWDEAATTWPSAAILPEDNRKHLPDTATPEQARITVMQDKPVFFGHYWMTGTPAPLTLHAACVDYSAGNGGPLVAYRWNGETRLDAANFAWVG
jgi:hypothetical protein